MRITKLDIILAASSAAYEALKKYKDDPEIYLHFSSRKALGINPKGGLGGGPLGIYFFPLLETWDRYHVEKTKDLQGFNISDRFMHVCRIKKSKNLITNKPRNYTDADLAKDIVRLRALWESSLKQELPKVVLNPKFARDFDTILKKGMQAGETWDGEHTAITKIWCLTMNVASALVGRYTDGNDHAVWWAKIIQMLGYTGFEDKIGANNGYISGIDEENIQTVCVTMKGIEKIEMIELTKVSKQRWG